MTQKLRLVSDHGLAVQQADIAAHPARGGRSGGHDLMAQPGAGDATPATPLQFAPTRRKLIDDERGAVTAEYAIVIMAAVAFAGLLVAIMRSSEIRAMLVQLVENALGSAG